ncbi:MAG: cytosine-specific methyltransferase [Chloroflexota bacterium]
MKRRPRTLISLFSGAGGLDLGLERAGFETRVMVEVDRDARATVERNRAFFGERDFPILSDITAVSAQEIMEAAGLARGEATLVAGGPPCQSFSTAGRRQSIGDPRGSLFIHFADMIQAAQPRFFVMENVRGLLSAAVRHRPLAERGTDHPPLEPEEMPGSAFRIILDQFDALGYQYVYGLVNAAEYGVPQTRERLIVIGSRDHELPHAVRKTRELVIPTHGPDDFVTLGDVLDALPPHEPISASYSEARAEIFDLIPEGGNWRHIRDHYSDDLLRHVMGGAYDSDGGRVGFFRRLSRLEPSPTLPTSPVQKSTALCHPLETRPLSVQEYAAIQQFPFDYDFAGSVASQYRQIGNAVPVGLGEAIGKALMGLTRKRPQKRQMRLLEESRV